MLTNKLYCIKTIEGWQLDNKQFYSSRYRTWRKYKDLSNFTTCFKVLCKHSFSRFNKLKNNKLYISMISN